MRILVLFAVGCTGTEIPPGDTGPRPPAELLDMSVWVEGDDAVAPDPLASHRPTDGVCPPGSVLVEGGSVEVQTGICTYAWLQQPALTDLRKGERVELVFWHSALVADGPAEGHLALWVDDEPLYDRVVPIPADATAYTESVVVPFTSPEGAIVTFHLHNHGANTWNLLRVERTED